MGFSPRTEGLTWRAIRAMTSSDRGLRLMMSTLSTLPVDSWWQSWTPADRASARSTFAAMSSGSGFVTDLRQGAPGRSSYRQALIRSVPCPTLVTASRHDGGVRFDHAKDFARSIPRAQLFETNAEQIVRVEELSDAHHLAVGGDNVMIAYLLEIERGGGGQG